MAEPMSDSDAAATPEGLEVATLSADTLRANVRVTGVLAPATSPVLLSILRTHVGTGRRYLRVDLQAAEVDPDVIASLVDAHRAIADLGGMLVFEKAGPRVVDAIRGADLFAPPPPS